MIRQGRKVHVCARSVLQGAVFDAGLMLLNRRPAQEVVGFLHRKIRSLTHPQQHIIVMWDGDGMSRDSFWGVRRESGVETRGLMEDDEEANPEKEIEDFLEGITKEKF